MASKFDQKISDYEKMLAEMSGDDEDDAPVVNKDLEKEFMNDMKELEMDIEEPKPKGKKKSAMDMDGEMSIEDYERMLAEESGMADEPPQK